MDMKRVKSLTFTAPLIREGSWGEEPLGTSESEMTLYENDDRTRAFIEWDLPALDEVANIGLWFEAGPGGARTLTDYDGVGSLPAQACLLLESAGYYVPFDFKE